METEADIFADSDTETEIELTDRDSVITIVCSASKEKLTNPWRRKSQFSLQAEVRIEKTSESLPAQRGVLIEEGIVEYSNILDVVERTIEVIGDCSDQYVASNAQQSQIKGFLFEQGIMRSFTREQLLLLDYSQQLKSLEVKQAQLKAALNQKSVRAGLVAKFWESEVHEGVIDMFKLVEDINEFTEDLENNPQSIDWQLFRANLQKIHRYYKSNLEETEEALETNLEDTVFTPESELALKLIEANHNATDILDPLNNIIMRTRSLRKNWKGIKCKSKLLFKFWKLFNAKYEQSELKRERANNELMILKWMQESIQRKLHTFEEEIYTSKQQLQNK
ncbi:CG32459 [Drosophila busckii]|uniref:CG32459 n=1 Tax=Drosophila busckii TaxID=30019 RepID=A0A0M4EK84_DROBS|nr:uncharacterized protein LOC108599882 isoform X1 [Drosophila busckii]ALC44538.1 CG32459 [Drosophila busckii]